MDEQPTQYRQPSVNSPARSGSILFWSLVILAVIIPVVGMFILFFVIPSSKRKKYAIMIIVIINILTLSGLTLFQEGYFNNYFVWMKLTRGSSPVAEALKLCKNSLSEATCIYAVATAQRDTEICKLLHYDNDFDDMVGDCYRSIGLATGDSSYCNLIGDWSFRKEDCIVKLADSVEECDNNVAEFLIDSCRESYTLFHGSSDDCNSMKVPYNCLEYFTDKYVVNCELYHENQQESCYKRNERHKRISQYKSFELSECMYLGKSSFNDECIAEVIAKTNDYNKCSLLTSESNKDNCYSESWRLGKNHECNKINTSKIGGESKLEECLRNVAFLTNDSTLCSTPSCYYLLAMRGDDSSLCDKGEFYKNACKASMLVGAEPCDIQNWQTNFGFYCKEIWEEYQGE